MRVRLVKAFSFEAAHWLPDFPDGHKCRRLHGHSFRVKVIVEGDIPEGRSYLVDYGDMKAAIRPIRDQLDHYCLNDIAGLENPTSEMLAHWIWERLKPALPELVELHVEETCESSCHYRGPAGWGGPS